MITGQLKNDVDKLWETFWTGGISNPLTVIEQITYLLYIKRMDEEQLRKEAMANQLNITVENPIYTEKERLLRWSVFKEKDPETMFDLFTKPQGERLTVFDKMKSMGTEGSAFAGMMKGATFMIPEARLLDKAVQMIDKLDMRGQDTKGDLYEYLLSKIASAGKNGQFRTPRHIIRMMVDMVKPTPEDTICDPAAGTMGFLVGASEYVREHYADTYNFDENFKKHFRSDMFTGVEFDSTMMRIGAMNLMLHGVDEPNLVQKDALSESNKDIKDAFSLILANPPFKGSLDRDAVDKAVIKKVDSKKTELLFLGLMLRMLRPGGRAAVIVPDGVLFGSSNAHQQIRKEIIDKHQLQAVISMPSGVFKPYAGVSTAVLFFTRTDMGGTDKVWFYDMQADGFSLDDKRNPLGSKQTDDSLQQSHEDNNIPDILQRWEQPEAEAKRPRTAQSFLVPVDEIRKNKYDLSINRYKEIAYEAVEYDPPAVILERIEKLDAERQSLMQNLKTLLSDAEIFGNE
jgi:type I restriction enzyme M protein